MQAEVIAVGDELVSGQRLDTNSQWLSQQLGYLGIPVQRHVTVGDQLHANIEVMREAAARSQVVLISGGLGPTLDDLTREALASAFALPLESHAPSLAHIEQLFARRGRPMPERNRIQAMFPRGTRPIPNTHGSAPGIDLTVHCGSNDCRFFALPGVPAEMKQMWEESVKQRLEESLGDNRGSLYFRTIKLFGLGESEVEARVPSLIARDRNPTVGITVSQATITLRVSAKAKSEAEFERLIAPTLLEIHQNLGELIFGYGEDELYDALLRELSALGHSVAVLEIGAGTWINEAMQAATAHRGLALAVETISPNQSYRGGLVLPDMADAVQWLGYDSGDRPEGDDELLRKMTQKIRQQLGASIGLCVLTYPSEAEILRAEAGTAFPFCWAVEAPNLFQGGFKLERTALGGHPEVLNARMAKTAVNWLRKELAGRGVRLQ